MGDSEVHSPSVDIIAGSRAKTGTDLAILLLELRLVKLPAIEVPGLAGAAPCRESFMYSIPLRLEN